MIRKKKIVLQT